jgi:hypothetical protein
MNDIADIVPNPDMVMFVDEAARNNKTSFRKKGWSLKGRRCVQRRCFVRGQRFSILPVLTLDGIITYDIIPGSVTSERFLQFLCELVVSFILSVLDYSWRRTLQITDPSYKPLPWPSKRSDFGQL